MKSTNKLFLCLPFQLSVKPWHQISDNDAQWPRVLHQLTQAVLPIKPVAVGNKKSTFCSPHSKPSLSHWSIDHWNGPMWSSRLKVTVKMINVGVTHSKYFSWPQLWPFSIKYVSICGHWSEVFNPHSDTRNSLISEKGHFCPLLKLP